MIRTVKEWKDFCLERGTSGDQVFDILKDWAEDVGVDLWEKEDD